MSSNGMKADCRLESERRKCCRMRNVVVVVVSWKEKAQERIASKGVTDKQFE